MIPARELVHALGGRWHGSYGSARCPVHKDTSPSLSVRESYAGPIVHCFAGCDFRDVRDELKSRGLLKGPPRRAQEGPRKRITAPASKDDAERTSCALELWHEAKPLGALAQKYLASRGIDMSEAPDMHHVLRFDPSCPFGPGERHPCIIGLWTDAHTGEPKAIHRTALTAHGRKIDRKSLGPTAGCVIRLWPDECVTQGLVVGEGIETTLAAATRCEYCGALMQPAWACGDAGHLMRFPPLAGVEALTIAADNDPAGKAAAESCEKRWRDAGREVCVVTPHAMGGDFADFSETHP